MGKGLWALLATLLLAACQAPAVRHEASPHDMALHEAQGHSTLAAATTAAAPAAQKAMAGERLGTQWGDEVVSRVHSVDLRRASHTPLDEALLRYADKSYRGRQIQSMSLAAGKIELAVQSDGRTLPLVRDGSRYYLRGEEGRAYQLVYRNRSGNTYEIVASVDGLDVLSGQAASRRATGYVLNAHGTLVIEGFRKSDSAVASFIFSKPRDAYAANTPAGSIANTGVIGTVVYELYDPAARRPRLQQKTDDGAQAFPADADKSGYAPPPQ